MTTESNDSTHAGRASAKRHDAMWEAELAKRSIARLRVDTESEIRRQIESVRRSLADAERRLDAGQIPSTCGILQGRAIEVEMALARMDVLRDARRCVDALARAIPAADPRSAS